jgi:cytoskeletal protein CcmA (bactofilin family)
MVVAGDVSFNSNLFVAGDVSFNGNLIANYPDSTIPPSAIIGGVSTGIFINDISASKRMFVAGDVSLNSKLFVAGDVSFNGNLRANYPDSTIPPSAIIGGVSTGIFINDISASKRMFVAGDVSLNSRLFVAGDISLNGNIVIGRNLIVKGNLAVQNYQNQNIINTTTTNYQLIVSEDLSLNGRLCVSSDTSLNGKLFVANDISCNGNISAKPNSIDFNSIRYGINNQFSTFQYNYQTPNTATFDANGFAILKNIDSSSSVIYSTTDVSVNGNLFVGRDISYNGNLYLTANSIDPMAIRYGISNQFGAFQYNYATPNTATYDADGFGVLRYIDSSSQVLYSKTDLSLSGNLFVNSINIGRGGGLVATNTAIGASAIQSNTTGANNTALGYQAGYAGTANTLGSNNTYVGYNTQANANNYSNSTAIGAGAVITGNNQVVLGRTTETVRYNKLSPLYTSIPTFASTDIGYTASFSLATLAFGTGARNTTNTSIALPIGVYMCVLYYQINITFPGTTRNIVEFHITSGATLATRAIMGLVYAPAIQEYNYYSIPAILTVSANPCSVYSELTANGGNCSINSAALAVVRIA